MAKKKVGAETELRVTTTIVVDECNKDEQEGHYIVLDRGGQRYRSKKPVQPTRAYEISPVLSAANEKGQSDNDTGYYIFSGPLTLRGGAVATTEGKRK